MVSKEQLLRRKTELEAERSELNAQDYVTSRADSPKTARMFTEYRSGRLEAIDADLGRVNRDLKAYELSETKGTSYNQERRYLKSKDAAVEFRQKYSQVGTDDKGRELYQRKDIIAAQEGRATREQLRHLRYEDRSRRLTGATLDFRISGYGRTTTSDVKTPRLATIEGPRIGLAESKEGLKTGPYQTRGGKYIYVVEGGVGRNTNAQLIAQGYGLRYAYARPGEMLAPDVYVSPRSGRAVGVRVGGTGINEKLLVQEQRGPIAKKLFKVWDLGPGAANRAASEYVGKKLYDDPDTPRKSFFDVIGVSRPNWARQAGDAATREVRENFGYNAAMIQLGGGTAAIGGKLAAKGGWGIKAFKAGGLFAGTTYAGTVGSEIAFSGRPAAEIIGREAPGLALFGAGYSTGGGTPAKGFTFVGPRKGPGGFFADTVSVFPSGSGRNVPLMVFDRTLAPRSPRIAAKTVFELDKAPTRSPSGYGDLPTPGRGQTTLWSYGLERPKPIIRAKPSIFERIEVIDKNTGRKSVYSFDTQTGRGTKLLEISRKGWNKKGQLGGQKSIFERLSQENFRVEKPKIFRPEVRTTRTGSRIGVNPIQAISGISGIGYAGIGYKGRTGTPQLNNLGRLPFGRVDNRAGTREGLGFAGLSAYKSGTSQIGKSGLSFGNVGLLTGVGALTLLGGGTLLRGAGGGNTGGRPKTPPPWGFGGGFGPFRGYQGRSRGSGYRGGGSKRAYFPSLSAVSLGIRAPKSYARGRLFSGFEIRPVI